jgi:hypothetical protein
MVENLTHEQTEQVLRFLLQRMGMDTRGELMAALPLAYIALHPHTVRTVVDKVQAAADRDAKLVEHR